DRPRALVRPVAAADGRAVRRARRDDARAAEHGAAADLGGERLDDRLRHPLDCRGRLPLDARRRHVGPPPAHRRHRLPHPAVPAHRADARGPALLRARDRGARAPGNRRRGARVTLQRRIVDWLPAAGVFVLGILLWQGLVAAFNVQEFLLPKPTVIAQTFWDERHTLWHAGIYTFKEALGGFALGSSLGIAFALLFAAFRPLGTAFKPFAVAASAVPIIAFAPIMNDWFGLLNPFSKMAIAAVLCFFPVLINALGALSSVAPRALELRRSYPAGRWPVFRRVRIPASLPHTFAGLKIASVLSMIGAIVGEYFGGPTTALGVTILNASAYSDFELAWAGIVVASAFGILFYGAVALAERLTTSWDPSRRAFHTE